MGAILSRFNCLKAHDADGPSTKPKAAPDDIDDQPTPRSAPAVKHAKSEPAPQTTAPEAKDASQQPDSESAPAPTPPTGVLAPPEAEQSGVASDTAHAETGLAQPQRKDTIEIIIDDDEIPGTRAPTNQPIHAGPRQPGGPPPRPPPPPPPPPRGR